MRLNHLEREKLCLALEHSFSVGTLRQMLSFKLGVALHTISSDYKTLPEQILDLVTWAEQCGRVKDLVNGALQQNSGSPELIEFAQLWQSQVGRSSTEFWQPLDIGGVVVGRSRYNDVLRAFGPSEQEGYDADHSYYLLHYPRRGILFMLDVNPSASQEVCQIVLTSPFSERLLGCLRIGMPKHELPAAEIGAYKRQFASQDARYAIFELGGQNRTPHDMIIMYPRGQVTEIRIRYMVDS